MPLPGRTWERVSEEFCLLRQAASDGLSQKESARCALSFWSIQSIQSIQQDRLNLGNGAFDQAAGKSLHPSMAVIFHVHI
jgi:hypothetical protein